MLALLSLVVIVTCPGPAEAQAEPAASYRLQAVPGGVAVLLQNSIPVLGGVVCVVVDPALSTIGAVSPGSDLAPGAAVYRTADTFDDAGQPVAGGLIVGWLNFAVTADPSFAALPPAPPDGWYEAARIELLQPASRPLAGCPAATLVAGLRTSSELLLQRNIVTDTEGSTKSAAIAPTLDPALRVCAFRPTGSGFEARFSRPVEPSVLTMYAPASSGLGAAAATLTGPAGVVAGSLVVGSGSGGGGGIGGSGTLVTFVATGGALLGGEYTAVLRGADDAFREVGGGALDGDEDGVPGGDFTVAFTVTASAAVVLDLPDVVRGPGQAINVPAGGDGIPIAVSDASAITGMAFDLVYDPGLLNVSDIVPAPGMPATAAVTADLSTPGRVHVDVSVPEPPAPGARDLLVLRATVPGAAAYGAAHVLALSELTVNDGTVPATADDGLHVVAYFGDTTGNGTYGALDAQRILRFAVGLDTGHTAYPLVDPVVLDDMTGNGEISSLDAVLVLREAVGLDVPEIPPLPAVLP